MPSINSRQIGRRAPAKWNTSAASQNTQRQYWTFRVHMQSSHGKQTVLVYDGEGAGSRSVLSAVESLRNSLSSQVQVAQLGQEALLSGAWQEECLMLVMPGGADLPYCRQLNGRGNSLIRGFVEAGGAYLGLCAGAYYACSYVEFALGTKLEVKGPRELAFFPGTAAGPVYGGFRYETEDGAHAARVAFQPPQPARAVACINGDTPVNGDSTAQGTPSFAKPAVRSGHSMPAAGSASAPGEAGFSDWEDGTQSSCVSAQEPHEGWMVCRDYTNGGPQFIPCAAAEAAIQPARSSGHASDEECSHHHYECLAIYPDKGNGLAAVRCPVGAGIAVLVGTHPELDPKRLLADIDRVPAVADDLKPNPTQGDGSTLDVQSGYGFSGKSVREQLERCRADRGLFWTVLLQSAGLGSYCKPYHGLRL